MAVSTGLDAFEQARAGVKGSLDLLEAPGGMLETSCWLPLHHAYTGLGQAWLTETISFPRWPGPAAWHSVYDAIHEVLQRHIKAADKRLRADQVERITIKVPAPSMALDRWMERHGIREAASLGHAVRHGIGALVVDHELGTEQLDMAGWEERRLAYGMIAGRVRVEHDVSLTLDFMGHMVESVSPLIGGVTEGEWRGLLERVRRPEVAWPSVSFSDVRNLVQHRPDKWFKAVRYAPRDLAQARLPEWQMRLGAAVEINTTRGGCWPERRAIAENGPGWSYKATRDSVLQRFAADDPARAEQAPDLLGIGLDEDAEVWLKALVD